MTLLFGHEKVVDKMGAAFAQSMINGLVCLYPSNVQEPNPNPKEFLQRDETIDVVMWIHDYMQGTKESVDNVETGPEESAPKKERGVPSTGKNMATIF